jgi:predicted permease
VLPALVLLIACANVANLFLARAEARRRELAVRAAIGAGRGRLFRQLLAESALLSFSGAFAGLLAAVWLIGLFPRLVPEAAITYTIDARLDHRVLVFGLLLAIATTALVALGASSGSTRPDLAVDLKAERSSAAGSWSRHLIVAAETAVGVLVLVSAGLLVRSLQYGANLRPGFDARKEVATVYVVPALKGYTREATFRFLERAREALAGLPSVRRVSYGIRLPAQGNEAGWAADFVIPGKDPPAGEPAFRIRYTMVGPDYFEVMGTRILAGRSFHASDGPDGEPVAIVSATMAERLFRGEDPLGKTLVMGLSEPVSRRIVGVAEDIRIADLYEAPEMYVYVPYAQDPQNFGLLLIEVAEGARAESILAPASVELGRLAPDLPLLMTGTFDRHMKAVLYQERRDAWIAAAIGTVALLLTTVGIYGVLTIVTARRAREIGIRVVLGARRKDVLKLVLGHALALALAGAASGLAGAYLVSRYLESRLHGISTRDPYSFLFGALSVVGIALIASLVPALRATRVDPVMTMRSE